MTTIAIDPVTRIEGHGQVFLELDEHGEVADAGLVVNELRGFERILVGMEADRMPLVTARICGVCPSAHHFAAVKALDAAAGVEPPPAAKLLRELMYLGHIIHSHTLSLFVLQGPDLVLGLDADPATRNVVGVVAAAPDVARKALRLRTLGQSINELIGGRGVHPVTLVAGGIAFRMDHEKHGKLTSWFDEAVALVGELGPLAKTLLLRTLEQHPALLSGWRVPSASLGTVQDGRLSFCDGLLRAVSTEGTLLREFPAREYDEHLVESALPWSYMKPVFLRQGGEELLYRVGPLGRLNCADHTGTPLADAELAVLRSVGGQPCHGTVFQVWARVIELIHACERGQALAREPALFGETRVPVRFHAGRAVGHVEAPRGTLIHDYEIDEQGIVRAANLIVATQQNYAAINLSIRQAAQSHVVGRGDSALLNAVEFAIRCYDPCLSCATHALGQMPLEVTLRRGGEVLRRIRRGS